MSTIPTTIWLYSNLLEAQANSLNSIFDNCKADADCNAKYPKLQTAYTDIIQRLDKTPLKLMLQNPHCEQEECDLIEIPINDNLFSGYVVNELFTANPIPRMPKLINDTYNGDYTDLIEAINAQQAGGHVIGTSWGRYYSTVCHDMVDSENVDTIEKAADFEVDLAALQPIKITPNEQCTIYPAPNTSDHLQINCLDFRSDKFQVEMKLNLHSDNIQFQLINFGPSSFP